MTNRSLRGTLATSFVLFVACSTDPIEHPPFCDEPRCIPHIATKVSGSAGSSGAGEDESTAGGSGAAVVVVNGQVVEVEESFSVRELGGTFAVAAPGADGRTFSTSPLSAIFTLEGVLRSRPAWLTAKPINQSDLYPGLVAFDSTTGASPLSVVIPLYRRSNLDLVAKSLTSLPTLDDTKAQVVLRFVDSDGTPVAGVSVAMAGAEHVAYDVASGYTDDASATRLRGLAFLLNVDASATPSGRGLNLGGVVSGAWEVMIQAGSATVLSIAVSAK